MESKLYQMTLKEFLEYHPLKLHFGGFEINEGDIAHLHYFYVHSKDLLLNELVKDAWATFDSVLFFDMSFSVDFSRIDSQKVLRYNIFNAWEFLIHLKSVYSFLKDSKMRSLIIIDSWNTYLWNEGEREKMLSKMIEKKCWDTIIKLKKSFLTTFVICKKTATSGQRMIATQFCNFNLIEIPKIEEVKGFCLLDPKLSADSSTLLHALIDENYKRISIFVHPFKWKSIESILLSEE